MSRCREASKEDLENLKDYFYHRDGKLFARKAYCNRVKKGQEVGCNNGQNYLVVMCKGRLYMVHRVIYYLSNNIWPKGVVDHKNGNGLDNNPYNLRDLTQGENTRSYGPAHNDSTSKYRGVHWFRRDSRWQAQIHCKGKKYHLGYFDCQKEAAMAWNYMAVELGFNKEALNNVFK